MGQHGQELKVGPVITCVFHHHVQLHRYRHRVGRVGSTRVMALPSNWDRRGARECGRGWLQWLAMELRLVKGERESVEVTGDSEKMTDRKGGLAVQWGWRIAGSRLLEGVGWEDWGWRSERRMPDVKIMEGLQLLVMTRSRVWPGAWMHVR